MEDEPTSPLAAFLGNSSASWFGASPADDHHQMGTSPRAVDLEPLGVPLFEADKVFAVQAARGSGPKKSSGRSRSQGACQPRVCDPMDGLAPGKFLSGIFGGAGDEDEDDGEDASSSPSREAPDDPDAPEHTRREFVAATCSSAFDTRPGDARPARVFHAAAHSSEGFTKHHLLLRAEERTHTAGDDDEDRPPVLRALPWYEGVGGRITSMAFSPGPVNDRLLCGTADGGVYVIPCDSVLAGEKDEGKEEIGTKKKKKRGSKDEPMIQVLSAGGSAVVATAWWRRDREEDAAVVVTAAGEVKFWVPNERGGDAPSPRVVELGLGRAESAELVDAGDTKFVLVAGYEREAESSPGERVYWTLALDPSAPLDESLRAASPEPVRGGRFGIDTGGDVEGLGIDTHERGGGGPGARWRAAASAAVSLPGERAPILQAHPGAGSDDGSTPLVSCLRRRAGGGRLGRLELFDPRGDGVVPVAVHVVPRGTVSVRVTRRFVFALNGVVGRRARLTVIARRKLGGEPGAHVTTDNNDTGDTPDVALQEIVLSSNGGVPRALMPPTGPGPDAKPGSTLEGCAVWMSGAILECRPALPSVGAVFRGLMGASAGPGEAAAFSRASENAGGKDGARRLRRAIEAAAARGLGYWVTGTPETNPALSETDVDGDAKVAALSVALGVDPAPLYLDAARDATRAGEVGKAKALFARAEDPGGPARFIAMCLREWRAADALDQLTDGMSSLELDGAGAGADKDWLALCCGAHLRLSAWAASTAAVALGAAGEFAEKVDLPPLPSGAMPPPIAAKAAGDIAAACAEQGVTHERANDVAAAAEAAGVAAGAAGAVTDFLDACVRSGGETELEPARATMRVMLAASLAVDTLHRSGHAALTYAPPPVHEAASEDEVTPDDVADADAGPDAPWSGPAASPHAAAMDALAPTSKTTKRNLDRERWSGAKGESFEGERLEGEGLSVGSCPAAAVLPLMTPSEMKALARSASIGDSAHSAAEARLCTHLALAAVHRETRREKAGQRSLERALVRALESGAVDPGWAGATCLGWDNPRAASIAYTHAERWLAATVCRVNAVLQATPDSHDFGDDFIPMDPERRRLVESELADLIRDTAPRCAGVRERGTALAALAKAWQSLELPQARLESLLLDGAAAGGDVGGEAAAALLRRNRTVMSQGAIENHDPEMCKIPLSAKFALAIASLRVKASKRSVQGEEDAGDARKAWRRIRAALAADGSVSSSIRYPAPVVAAVFDEDVEPRSPGPYNLPVPSPPASPASFRRVAPRRDPHVDSYVFSCGHRFTGERMAATTTALRGRMKDAGMPLVGELLAADYALDRCAVACPGCVSRAVSTLAAAKI